VLVIVPAGAAFCATVLGGLFALSLKDKLHLMLGFSAGAVIGVVFFDLLPEAFELSGRQIGGAMLFSLVALGFLLYLVLDRVLLFRGLSDNGSLDAGSAQRSFLGAGSLCAHSFLDGSAIGFAFQASTAVGAVVTAAVLSHDFSDGINTVNIVLKNGGNRREALLWLMMDALAPALGIAATLVVTLPDYRLGFALALFAGFFLYIGASDLIPESHHRHPKVLTTIMTLLGAAVIYFAVVAAGR
jgi:zinc transporter ZupT